MESNGMNGGKTKQRLSAAANLRNLRSNPLKRCSPQQMVDLLLANRQRRALKIRAPEENDKLAKQLDHYLDPGLQRHFGALLAAAFPDLEGPSNRRAVESWLQQVPNPPVSKEQVWPILRRAYLQQLQKTLRQAPESAITDQEREKILATISLLQDIESSLDHPNIEPRSAYKEPIKALLQSLQGAPERRVPTIPRPAGPQADRDRLYEALEHAIHAASNALDLRPDSASVVTIINHFSDCAIKISGAEPEYKQLHVGNFVQSQPRREALVPYWDIFAAASSRSGN